MPRLNVPPTKSSLLTLRRQLSFAEEGYELLEQKRQILALELMSRLQRALLVEQRAADALNHAHASLREALLDAGSMALRRATWGEVLDQQAEVTYQRLPGVRVPCITIQIARPAHPLSLAETTIHADLARQRFIDALAILAELADLQVSIHRLARELQKTQRRCNALSRIFIPDYREAIAYITASLEEREREAFVILKMIRDRTIQ